jgi:3-hydroxyacyl-CoA dehydrogenase
MSLDEPIRRIAVGTGVIGASWAAQFLARGIEVIDRTRDSVLHFDR